MTVLSSQHEIDILITKAEIATRTDNLARQITNHYKDIVDTGHTLSQVQKILLTRNPKSLSICTLLNKPSRREVDVDVNWVGFDIPDAFVIGYGIDYAQQGRNLPHIGVVKGVK